MSGFELFILYLYVHFFRFVLRSFFWVGERVAAESPTEPTCLLTRLKPFDDVRPPSKGHSIS